MSWLREGELVVVACKVVVMYEKMFVCCCWTSERYMASALTGTRASLRLCRILSTNLILSRSINLLLGFAVGLWFRQSVVSDAREP